MHASASSSGSATVARGENRIGGAKRPRAALTIGSLVTYKNLTAARIDARRRLAAYDMQGKVRCALNAFDAQLFLCIVKESHPDSDEVLVNHSVKAVFAQRSEAVNRPPLICVERSDGRFVTLSSARAFASDSSERAKRRTAVLLAMQEAVSDQKRAFLEAACSKRSALYVPKCAESGRELDLATQRVHVEYRAPVSFARIVELYEEERGIDIETLPVHNVLADAKSQRAGAPSKYKHVERGLWQFQHEHLERDWCDFHSERAVYRLVSDDVVQSKTSAKRKK